MFLEILDLNKPFSINFIANDQAGIAQLPKKIINVE